MDAENGTTSDRLAWLGERKRELVQAAAKRGFFALISLLERLEPGAVRLGGGGPASSEPVRFRHDPRLTFATSDVTAVSERKGGGWDVMTTFLGVTGPLSPTPIHISEEVAHEDEDKQLRGDFLNLFHHRLVSLLYRMVARVDWPREARSSADDDWARRIVAFAGYDPWSDGLEAPLPRWRLLRLAPLLATRAKNARALRLALEDVVGPLLPGGAFSVEEFMGVWVVLEERHRARLGKLNSHLGRSLILGERMWDRSSAFRVTIGPVPQEAYDRLLPGGDLHKLAGEVVALVVDEPLDCELEIVMAATPPFVLRPPRARLGQNTWLGAGAHGGVRRVVELRA